MKTNLEILRLLKKVYEELHTTDGMCVELAGLYKDKLITDNERDKFEKFMGDNKPSWISKHAAYWWVYNKKTPRLKWINDMIEQQESKKKKP